MQEIIFVLFVFSSHIQDIKEDLGYVTDNLYSVTKSTGSWSYLIKKRAYEHLINIINYKKDYIAIDDHLCLLSEKGFKVLTTIPLLINHGVGFESTLQPNGPVNYNVWIRGNYHNFIYQCYFSIIFLLINLKRYFYYFQDNFIILN